MCGIVGIASARGLSNELRPRLESATNLLRHRGPDDFGCVTGRCAMLGHTRLAIIAPASGRQPMLSEDGRRAVTFNGEIFNYRELRRDLETRGCLFRTDSDTEVILRAFELDGCRSVTRLRGMFAFAICDFETGDIFAARDPYGIKPFFYSLRDGIFVFSSEIKALHDTGLVPFEPDASHFDEFLVFGYVAGEETLHRHVKELLPGHWLMFDRDRVGTGRYWSPVVPTTSAASDAAAIEAIEDTLRSAIQFWTTSDVEVGCLLSSGLDSSLVSKLANDVRPGIRAFTADLATDHSLCETEEAAGLAARIQCQHHIVAISDSFVTDNLAGLVKHFDEPIHDGNYLTLMALCAAIRNTSDLKVLLCGEGSDELFAGYARHRTVAQTYASTRDPEVLLYALNTAALPRLRVLGVERSIDHPWRDGLLREILRTTDDPVNAALLLDQQTFLIPYLHRQDRVGMLFGLEIRTPFLDHVLAESVNALPSSLKIRDGWHKWILRCIAEKHLPPTIAWKRTKIPLSAPISRLFTSGPLRTLYRDILHSSCRLVSSYSPAGAQRLLTEHDPNARGTDHGNTLWRLLSLELWLEEWAGRVPASAILS